MLLFTRIFVCLMSTSVVISYEDYGQIYPDNEEYNTEAKYEIPSDDVGISVRFLKIPEITVLNSWSNAPEDEGTSNFDNEYEVPILYKGENTLPENEYPDDEVAARIDLPNIMSAEEFKELLSSGKLGKNVKATFSEYSSSLSSTSSSSSKSWYGEAKMTVVDSDGNLFTETIPMERPNIPYIELDGSDLSKLLKKLAATTTLRINLINLFSYLMATPQAKENKEFHAALEALYNAFRFSRVNVDALLPTLKNLFQESIHIQLQTILMKLTKIASTELKVHIETLIELFKKPRIKTIFKPNSGITLPHITQGIRSDSITSINYENPFTGDLQNVKYFVEYVLRPILKELPKNKKKEIIKNTVYLLIMNLPLDYGSVDIMYKIRDLAHNLMKLKIWDYLIPKLDQMPLGNIYVALKEFLHIVMTAPKATKEIIKDIKQVLPHIPNDTPSGFVEGAEKVGNVDGNSRMRPNLKHSGNKYPHHDLPPIDAWVIPGGEEEGIDSSWFPKESFGNKHPLYPGRVIEADGSQGRNLPPRGSRPWGPDYPGYPQFHIPDSWNQHNPPGNKKRQGPWITDDFPSSHPRNTEYYPEFIPQGYPGDHNAQGFPDNQPQSPGPWIEQKYPGNIEQNHDPWNIPRYPTNHPPQVPGPRNEQEYPSLKKNQGPGPWTEQVYPSNKRERNPGPWNPQEYPDNQQPPRTGPWNPQSYPGGQPQSHGPWSEQGYPPNQRPHSPGPWNENVYPSNQRPIGPGPWDEKGYPPNQIPHSPGPWNENFYPSNQRPIGPGPWDEKGYPPNQIPHSPGPWNENVYPSNQRPIGPGLWDEKGYPPNQRPHSPGPWNENFYPSNQRPIGPGPWDEEGYPSNQRPGPWTSQNPPGAQNVQSQVPGSFIPGDYPWTQGRKIIPTPSFDEEREDFKPKSTQGSGKYGFPLLTYEEAKKPPTLTDIMQPFLLLPRVVPGSSGYEKLEKIRYILEKSDIINFIQSIELQLEDYRSRSELLQEILRQIIKNNLIPDDTIPLLNEYLVQLQEQPSDLPTIGDITNFIIQPRNEKEREMYTILQKWLTKLQLLSILGPEFDLRTYSTKEDLLKYLFQYAITNLREVQQNQVLLEALRYYLDLVEPTGQKREWSWGSTTFIRRTVDLNDVIRAIDRDKLGRKKEKELFEFFGGYFDANVHMQNFDFMKYATKGEWLKALINHMLKQKSVDKKWKTFLRSILPHIRLTGIGAEALDFTS